MKTPANFLPLHSRKLNHLLRSVSAIAFLTAFPAAAVAQDAGSSASIQTQEGEPSDARAPASDAERSEADGGQDTILVTGTRIPRPEFAFPNPVQSFTAETIEESGETNLTEFLADAPALNGSVTNARNAGSQQLFSPGSVGLNLLNLRHLGTSRTLVLVDGRRHVGSSDGSTAVDINTIPSVLIDRVDILTGGVSAIYGADAVSGVVNFVLKRDFEGLSARGQAGISEFGDAGRRFGSVALGKNFADHRGNITVAYEYSKEDHLDDGDRPFTGDPLRNFQLRRTERGDSPDVFDRTIVNDVGFLASSPLGGIDLGSLRNGVFIPGRFDGLADFLGTGARFNLGTRLGTSFFSSGGDNTRSAGSTGDLLPSIERHNVNLLTSFAFSPAFRIFADGKYVNSTGFTRSQASFDIESFLAPENPFLVQRFGALARGGALLNRDNFDYGRFSSLVERETLRGVIGANGGLNDHLRYEVSYVYGRTSVRNIEYNERLEDRYWAALDVITNPATGRPDCRINVFPNQNVDPFNDNFYNGPPVTFKPGQCVPLNPLGAPANQDAIDFFSFDSHNRAKITQHVVSGALSGDLGFLFEFPGGAIGFALGAEYRKETSSGTPSIEAQRGFIKGLRDAPIAATRGEFDVKEVFGEINIPLLKNAPFAEVLSVGAAVRFSDYSTVGNTTAWKVDGVYAPVPHITFRGTYSQAVRAPNIAELFQPRSGVLQGIDDPCDTTNIGEGTQFRAANCAAALAAVGLSPQQIANFSPSTSPAGNVTKPGLSGGNPNLREETAKTWTAGVVLRPSFIPGLAMAVDWYDTKIKNAVNTASANQVVALCVDQETLNNPFCGSVGRAQGTGFVNFFFVGPQNVASFETSGLDATVNYRFTPGRDLGTFNMKFTGEYLQKLDFVPLIGAPVDHDAKEAGVPKYVATGDVTWTKGSFSLNYGLSFFSRTRRFTVEQLRANPDLSDPRYFFLKERWEHDVRASYDTDRFSFFGGINNFTDEKPAFAFDGLYPVSPIGRFFYVGAKVRLADIF